MEIFGVKFAPVLLPLERRLQTFAVLFWISSFLFMGPISTSILVWLLWTKYRWITILYLTWFIYDRNTPFTGKVIVYKSCGELHIFIRTMHYNIQRVVILKSL